MERKTLVGLLLVIAGLTVISVSIWALVDVDTIPHVNVSMVTPDSPKIGVGAGVLAVIVGIACFLSVPVEDNKNIFLIVIVVLLALCVATFGVAIKERMDIKKAEDIQAVLFDKQLGPVRPQVREQVNQFMNLFKKMKTQLVVLAIASGFGTVFEIIALILVSRFHPTRTSGNAMPMEKSY